MSKRKVTDDKWNALFDFIVYYGSYLWLPSVVILFILHSRDVIGTGFLVFALVVIAISFYGRFIEPRWLQVEKKQIDLSPDGHEGPGHTIRVALFSDTHYGIFKHAMPLERLRLAIEGEGVDLVIVAGDLTNHLMVHEIDETFAPFKDFSVPVYGVLGNHDFGRPGWLVADFLRKRLEHFGVTLMEGRCEDVEVNGHRVRIAGLLDHYTGPADHQHLTVPPEDAPDIVIAHNPDTVLHFPDGANMGILLSGHTHGGQVRLPVIYRSAIPTSYAFDVGYHETGGHKVYVSSGTGMDVLPVRLFIPPRLDILTLRLPLRGGQGEGEGEGGAEDGEASSRGD